MTDAIVTSYWSIDKFVSVSWILLDLLNSSCPRALQRDNIGLARKQGFVLQVFNGKPCRLVDKSADVEEVVVLVDDRDAAVIAHKMVFIVCESCLYKSVLGPSVVN